MTVNRKGTFKPASARSKKAALAASEEGSGQLGSRAPINAYNGTPENCQVCHGWAEEEWKDDSE